MGPRVDDLLTYRSINQNVVVHVLKHSFMIATQEVSHPETYGFAIYCLAGFVSMTSETTHRLASSKIYALRMKANQA